MSRLFTLLLQLTIQPISDVGEYLRDEVCTFDGHFCAKLTSVHLRIPYSNLPLRIHKKVIPPAVKPVRTPEAHFRPSISYCVTVALIKTSAFSQARSLDKIEAEIATECQDRHLSSRFVGLYLARRLAWINYVRNPAELFDPFLFSALSFTLRVGVEAGYITPYHMLSLMPSLTRPIRFRTDFTFRFFQLLFKPP